MLYFEWICGTCPILLKFAPKPYFYSRMFSQVCNSQFSLLTSFFEFCYLYQVSRFNILTLLISVSNAFPSCVHWYNCLEFSVLFIQFQTASLPWGENMSFEVSFHFYHLSYLLLPVSFFFGLVDNFFAFSKSFLYQYNHFFNNKI